MTTDPAMRASDRDRESVAETLREAHAEGRLTMSEFDERIDATYAARTLGELAPLTRDLPAAAADAPGGAPAVRRPSTAPTPHGRGWAQHHGSWRAWASAVLVCSVIWAIVGMSSGDSQGFWPVWVAGPWGAVLLARSLFGEDRGHPDRPGRRDGEIDHR